MSEDFIYHVPADSPRSVLQDAALFAILALFVLAVVATCHRPTVHVLPPDSQHRVDSVGKNLCKTTLNPDVRALVCEQGKA